MTTTHIGDYAVVGHENGTTTVTSGELSQTGVGSIFELVANLNCDIRASKGIVVFSQAPVPEDPTDPRQKKAERDLQKKTEGLRRQAELAELAKLSQK
jgi:hypothetical protein